MYVKNPLSPYASLYQDVNKRIVLTIQNRTLIWQRPWALLPAPETTDITHTPIKIQECENLLLRMRQLPSIITDHQGPYYAYLPDYIGMPPMYRFNTAAEYYSTLFHEITHSSGHPDRMNRRKLLSEVRRSDVNYVLEELIAEFGAAYLCSLAGIGEQTSFNSAAYIDHFVRRLPSAVVIRKVLSYAQDAVEFLLPPRLQRPDE